VIPHVSVNEGNNKVNEYAYMSHHPRFYFTRLAIGMSPYTTLFVALILVFWSQCSEALVCNTSGTVGIRNNLIRSVIVDFEVPITTTLTDEELRLSFVLSVATSGRPLPITAARIEGGTKVNLTLYHQDTTETSYDQQTDAIVSVAFERLLTTRVLRVNGVIQTTSALCNTTDQMRPVLMSAIGSTPNLVLYFSEPVQPCVGQFFFVNQTTRNTRVSIGVTEFTSFGTAPTHVWYVAVTLNFVGGSPFIRVNNGSVCDRNGNPNLDPMSLIPERTIDLVLVTGFCNYYDSNRDGGVDSMLIPYHLAITKAWVNSTSATVNFNGQPQSGVVSNDEGSAVGPLAYIQFNEAVPPTSVAVILTLLRGYGPVADAAGAYDTVNTLVFGSYFLPYVTVSFLNSSTPNSPSDLLLVTYSRAVNPSSVAVSNIQGLSPNFTIVSATLVSSRQVAYRLQQTCANTTVPCIDTSQKPSFTLSGIMDAYGTLLSANDTLISEDRTRPTIAGVSTAVGSTTIKLLFSETIVFASSFVSRASFSLHANGLYAASVSPSTNAAEYTVTANRGIKGSDFAALLQGVNVTLVDTLGNQGTDEPGVIFYFNASVHDDDDDGLVDRLRIRTSTSHFAFTSSAAFSTLPVMTLGAVTRVSTTIADIAVTNGAPVDESTVVMYTAGGLLSTRLRQQLSTNGDGPLDGFEMASVSNLAEIQVPTETVTVTEGQDGMSYALAGGLIGGAAVVGIILGVCYSSSSSSSRSIAKTQSRHYRKQQRHRIDDSDSEEEEVELF